MRNTGKCFILGLSLITLSFVGCRKPDSNIGLALQPEEELLALNTDTLPFSLSMVPVDSLRTDERSRLLLGSTIDPISGFSEAWFSAELRLSQTSIDFGDNPICDSVVFTLKHNGPSYGLSFDQQLRVNQLADTMSVDSAYYGQSRLDIVEENLVDPSRQPVQMHPTNPVYNGADTLGAQVRIMLKPSFGQEILNADTTVFSSNDEWRKWFKGLAVRSESGGGGIVSLEPNVGVSYLRIHYHNSTDTTSYDLVMNSNAARVTHFRHVWPEPYTALNDSLAAEGTDQVVLLGTAGSYLRLNLFGIDELNLPEGAVVNRAEILLPVNEGVSKLSQPNFLTAFLRRESGGIELTPEATSPGVAYDGSYNPATNAYAINMPVYTQRRLNGEETRPYVYLYSELSSVAMEQVVLSGPYAETPAQFVVTWSQ
ncbi:MAG TPA: hypothetical protein DHV07_03785 [Flavobacteriales bacterium]|nr:hypothetical protein [Flavobacteriales bacterium]